MFMGRRGEVGGQVLDLETAVKDGILGGGGGGVGVVATTEKNITLQKMIKELNSIDVPSVFICPISLEPMQDPVTLCTGQTYERSNIMKWLSLGRPICPTTMQDLWDDSIIPNSTLRHLIHSWFSQKYSSLKKRSGDVEGRVLELLETLKKKVKGQAKVQALMELRQSVTANDSAKRTVVNNGGLTLITSMLGGFTTHVVASETIAILVQLNLSPDSKVCLAQPSKISLLVDTLNEGSINTKINCAKLLGMLIEGKAPESNIATSLSLLVGLLRLVKFKNQPELVWSGLRLLKTISSSYGESRLLMVRVGAIPQLVDALPNLNPECLELALHVIESLSTCQEGALALKDCSRTIRNIVKLVMNVPENCTRLALSILLAVCKISPEECSSVAVEAGLAAKLLLVIQSGCNPELKQQSAELLKLCSLNYTETIFISTQV
ncbi:unnamed protein product [Cuscuta epithymum]|uniref:U-box domain-containing protein n=1 Tax=Cuscuta epithymum TaxID=186058 RepID=A0AAV0E894_9ASTE|nr:unnamed protein product [Cuscuta epithymum]CAH9119389.1 unnamed protein product [Cuscuta epithymum]